MLAGDQAPRGQEVSPPLQGVFKPRGQAGRRRGARPAPGSLRGWGPGHQPCTPRCGRLGHPARPALSLRPAGTLPDALQTQRDSVHPLTPDKVGITTPTYRQKKRGSESLFLAPRGRSGGDCVRIPIRAFPFQRPAGLADCSKSRSAHSCRSHRWPPHKSMSSAPIKGTEHHMASSVNS